MNRFLVIALLIGFVFGCGGSESEADLVGAATTPGSAETVSVQPTVAQTAAPTGRPTLATDSPTSFPTEVFAALSNDPVPPELAASFQAALANRAGGGGISATVMTPNGTWSGTFGKADGVNDLQVDSQFGIASGTKPIIAAQVMLLVERGEIDLDAPATDYLPDDFTFDTNGATIRQLLSHRSGIGDWYGAVDFAADRDRVWTLEEVLALVNPARAPLGTFEYTDTNYNLLGLVIEHVGGKRLVDVLRSGSLHVPGTERLIYQPDEAPSEPIAMPAGESRDALEQGGGYLPSLSDTVDGAAGAMASDSISLARWWRAFCAGEIVSKGSLNEMATFYDNADFDYGLGVMNPAAEYAQGIGHMGANFGYNSWSACLTSDHAVVVVLINGGLDSGSIFDLGKPLIMAARTGA